MTFFVGFRLTKSAVIRVCSSFSNISLKWNNTDTNKLLTINYLYIIRCLLLKYRLIFFTSLESIWRAFRGVKYRETSRNISRYFKRRHLIIYLLSHDGQKRNQMLHLWYNCMVLVHLVADWLQTWYTKRNHKGIFYNDKTKQIWITISKPDPSEKIPF